VTSLSQMIGVAGIDPGSDGCDAPCAARDESTGPGHASLSPHITSCRLRAGGSVAEWIECTAASEEQATIVHFVGGDVHALECARPVAARWAILTGARVLLVACRHRQEEDHATAVERGAAAYTWLVREGCDADNTMFTADATDEDLMIDIFDAVGAQSAPVPTRGVIVRRRDAEHPLVPSATVLNLVRSGEFERVLRHEGGSGRSRFLRE